MNTPAHPSTFAPAERRLLLATPGIGAVVVDRLEAAGFSSLQALREAGAARVTEIVLAHLQTGGQLAWRNRTGAIARAIRVAAQRDSPRAAGAALLVACPIAFPL
jgi:hypothetical protein